MIILLVIMTTKKLEREKGDNFAYNNNREKLRKRMITFL